MDNLKNKLKNNPNNSILWIELGDLLCDDNKLFKSLKCYKRANELSPCNILQKKICSIEDELNIDTDDEEVINDEIINSEDSTNESSNKFLNVMLQNSMIKDKLNNPEFQQKILNNKNNFGIIFEDDDIMSVMKEMLNVYNKEKLQ
jgi:hypothetical protein